MVSKKKAAGALACLLMATILLLSSHSGQEKPFGLSDSAWFASVKAEEGGANPTPGPTLFSVPELEYRPGEEEPTEEPPPKWVIHGPLMPPEGMAYDEWKGIRYARDTVFALELDWHPYSYQLKSGNGSRKYLREYVKEYLNDEMTAKFGYRLEPANPVGRFEIFSAEAEPVGGEMKLRTGGYVDITVKARTSADFRYSFTYTEELYEGLTPSSADSISGFGFSDGEMYPFDLYTGVSLLNFIPNESTEDISPHEATDSGFVESHVSWNGRSIRILAREDHRNAGSNGWERSVEGDRCIVRIDNVVTEVIYTFRVPADYDGLAFAFPKSFAYQKPEEKKALVYPVEVYADILTNSDGEPIPLENYYFVRVSDLLQYFAQQAPAEGAPA